MSELKPCPFCGGAAHFFKITDLDDRNFGGDGICCGSCPVTTDLMFSLMEDCKPKLAEAWNRRAQPAQAGQVLTRDEIEEAFQQAADADDETHIRFARAIEQAVLAKRVPQWSDIETAPKDGSIFLCWVTAERYGETDEGQQYTQDVSQADFGWWRPSDDAGYFDCGCGQIADRQHISHWMPLPPPPGIVGEKGGA